MDARDPEGHGLGQVDRTVGLHRGDARVVGERRCGLRRALELEAAQGVLEHVSDMAPDGTGQAWGIGRWI